MSLPLCEYTEDRGVEKTLEAYVEIWLRWLPDYIQQEIADRMGWEGIGNHALRLTRNLQSIREFDQFMEYFTPLLSDNCEPDQYDQAILAILAYLSRYHKLKDFDRILEAERLDDWMISTLESVIRQGSRGDFGPYDVVFCLFPEFYWSVSEGFLAKTVFKVVWEMIREDQKKGLPRKVYLPLNYPSQWYYIFPMEDSVIFSCSSAYGGSSEFTESLRLFRESAPRPDYFDFAAYNFFRKDFTNLVDYLWIHTDDQEFFFSRLEAGSLSWIRFLHGSTIEFLLEEECSALYERLDFSLLETMARERTDKQLVEIQQALVEETENLEESLPLPLLVLNVVIDRNQLLINNYYHPGQVE